MRMSQSDEKGIREPGPRLFARKWGPGMRNVFQRLAGGGRVPTEFSVRPKYPNSMFDTRPSL